MRISDTNLPGLEKGYPIDISSIIKNAKRFETMCRIIPEDIRRTQENISDSKGVLVLIFGNLISLLRSLGLIKSEMEKDTFIKMNRDLNRCLGLIDKSEKERIISKGDEVSFYDLSAFKTELWTAYLSIAMDNLLESKKIYINKIKEDERIKDKERALFYVLYELISTSASVIYGADRMSASGSSSQGTYSSPGGWENFYVKSILNKFKKQKNPSQEGLKDSDDKSKTKKEESDEDYDFLSLENLDEEGDEEDEDLEETEEFI